MIKEINYKEKNGKQTKQNESPLAGAGEDS